MRRQIVSPLEDLPPQMIQEEPSFKRDKRSTAVKQRDFDCFSVWFRRQCVQKVNHQLNVVRPELNNQKPRKKLVNRLYNHQHESGQNMKERWIQQVQCSQAISHSITETINGKGRASGFSQTLLQVRVFFVLTKHRQPGENNTF